jgi:hypothetical protein
MKKIVFVLLAIALVTSLMLVAPMGCVTVPKSMEELGVEEFEEIALRFLEKVAVTPSSDVYVLGPVEPGTVVQEEASSNVTAVELEVPEALGTNYIFIVDDMPGYKFAHPMRYVWMQYECGETEVVDASWPPVILQPGVTLTPYSSIRSTVIDDVSFTGLTGSGAGITNSISDKPVTSPPNMTNTTAECGDRLALVIDGGDKDKPWYKGDLADNFEKDANSIATWLETNGYRVFRISQYWGNKKDGAIPAVNGKNVSSKALEAVFAAFAKNLSCCDNFFLYIAAHGVEPAIMTPPIPNVPPAFKIYSATGDGNHEEIGYDKLCRWLMEFPKCVKVTIFLDVCYSGAAIPYLTGLRDKLSKVTILTATDDKTEAAGGQSIDSATEDFMQGADKDNDHDGTKGDLGDRALQMWKEGKGYGAQICKDPAHDTLCDLDGEEKGDVDYKKDQYCGCG